MPKAIVSITSRRALLTRAGLATAAAEPDPHPTWYREWATLERLAGRA